MRPIAACWSRCASSTPSCRSTCVPCTPPTWTTGTRTGKRATFQGAVQGAGGQAGRAETPGARRSEKRRQSRICVLPFANMSGDPEQEYFSDGITEDITTDLGKVSALSVVSRNTGVLVQGRDRGRGRHRRARPTPRTCWRAACARRASAYASPRNSSMRPRTRRSGASVTTANSTTSLRCRTRSPRPSSPH